MWERGLSIMWWLYLFDCGGQVWTTVSMKNDTSWVIVFVDYLWLMSVLWQDIRPRQASKCLPSRDDIHLRGVLNIRQYSWCGTQDVWVTYGIFAWERMTIFSTVDDTSRAGLCRTRASHWPLANNTTIYHHDLFVCFDLLNRPDNPFSETSFLQVFGGYIRSI